MANRIAPRLLGFSFYWAWTLLCFQSTAAILPQGGQETVLAAHGDFFTWSLVATVFAHPLWAWIIHRKPAARLRTPWAFAALQSASILYVGIFGGLSAGKGGTGADVLAAAVVSGVTSALMDVRWSQVYGAQRPDVSGRSIALSVALGIALYFALCPLGRLSPALCLAAIALLPPAYAWTLGLNGRADEGAAAASDVPPAHNARQIAGILWRPVTGSLVFFFAYGCVEAIVAGKVDFNATHGLTLAVELVVALVLFVCLGRRARVSVGGVYGIALMLVSAGFMVLPLAMRMGAGGAGGTDVLFAATVLVGAGTALFDALLLCMIAHAAYDYRTPGGVVNGVARGVTVGASALGHLAGVALGERLWSGAVDMVAFALAVTYLLILSASFFLGRRRLVTLPVDDGHGEMAASEVLAPDPASAGIRHVIGAATGSDPAGIDRRTIAAAGGGPGDPDGTDGTGGAGAGKAGDGQLERLVEQRIEEVAFVRHLSRRETDVFALLARGRSLPYIAETLVLSENTVRSHTRRIYDKLGVHSKQELIDLVECGGANEGRSR